MAFELLTSYAEDTEQGMWPLLNQLEHSLPTILTSRFRIVRLLKQNTGQGLFCHLVNLINGEYKASGQGDRALLAMLRASEPPNKPAR